MKHAPLILSLLLAAGFVFFGVQKFGSENLIFETIAANSGLSIFEPYARILTGVAEITTALLLVIPRTRLWGAISGLGVLSGAIGFHLSPWLGIHVPGIGSGLFYTACAMFILTLITVTVLRKSGSTFPFLSR